MEKAKARLVKEEEEDDQEEDYGQEEEEDEEDYGDEYGDEEEVEPKTSDPKRDSYPYMRLCLDLLANIKKKDP